MDRFGGRQQQLHPERCDLLRGRREDARFPHQRGRHAQRHLRRNLQAAGAGRADLADDSRQESEDAVDVEDLAGARPQTSGRRESQHRGYLQQGHQFGDGDQARHGREGRRASAARRACAPYLLEFAGHQEFGGRYYQSLSDSQHQQRGRLLLLADRPGGQALELRSFAVGVVHLFAVEERD